MSDLKVIKYTTGITVQFGGKEHSGWLPQGSAKPLPTPIEELIIYARILYDGSGYILEWKDLNSDYFGDSFHETINDAIIAARDSFGIEYQDWFDISILEFNFSYDLKDIDQIQALWVLDKFPAEELPKVAYELMVNGHQGPSVTNLASFDKPTKHDIGEAFDLALVEIGKSNLNKIMAATKVSHYIVDQIANERINPLRGAQSIWCLWRICYIDKLVPFVTHYSDYEDAVENIDSNFDHTKVCKEIEDNIVKEAKDMINSKWELH